MGVALHGAGFILEPDEAERLRQDGSSVIRSYLGGKDLLHVPRERYLIDFSGLSVEKAREANPDAFQHVVNYVKPERDHNSRQSIRELWWRFGWERPLVRKAIAGLARYIGTTETAKHRVFQFLSSDVLADHMIICIANDDAFTLGILSSCTHVAWALAAGGRLGVGNDPRYNKTRCFENFPFPNADQAQRERIRNLAEQLDAYRKRQQSQHPDLTLTGMYNVLEKLKSGEALSAKEKVIHEQGLVSVLKQLHVELDLAVLEAYGWSDLAMLMQVVNGNASPGSNSTLATRGECKRALDDTLLERLVALNAERAAEEKKGLIRWLRPEFQNPGKKAAAPRQSEIEIEDGTETKAAARTGKLPWPKDLPDQVRQVADVLATAREPMSLDAIAERFTGKGPWKRRLPQIVETLETLGRARRVGNSLVGVG